jgi:hypothetical protein
MSLRFEDARQPLLPPWVVTCFTINVIMGSGFLGVPAGFLSSGLVLGPAILVFVTFLQWVASCLLVQVASRAHALLVAKGAAATLTPTLAPFASLLKDASGGPHIAREDPRPPSLALPSHTSYEIMMLCRLHLGRWAERLTMLATTLYMVGALWSFISVFASSLAATVPMPWLQSGEPCDIYQTDIYGGGCITLYYWWVLSFAVVMSVLLALDLFTPLSLHHTTRPHTTLHTVPPYSQVCAARARPARASGLPMRDDAHTRTDHRPDGHHSRPRWQGALRRYHERRPECTALAGASPPLRLSSRPTLSVVPSHLSSHLPSPASSHLPSVTPSLPTPSHRRHRCPSCAGVASPRCYLSCAACSRSLDLWVASSLSAQCWLGRCSPSRPNGSSLASSGRLLPALPDRRPLAAPVALSQACRARRLRRRAARHTRHVLADLLTDLPIDKLTD